VLVQDHGHGFQLDNDVRAMASPARPASPARLVPAGASPAASNASGGRAAGGSPSASRAPSG